MVQKQIHTEIKRAFELTRPLGRDYELKFTIGTPPILNHPTVVELLQRTTAEMLGDEHILPFIRGLGAEDFSCFTGLAPGAIFYLGARIEGDERFLHNRHFDIDEIALPISAAILAEAALNFLTTRAKTLPGTLISTKEDL